ncbi:MAG: hypothetical protein HIU88_10135 [Acidobacteria bacterium]|nr:hypothetical protein [Acidobacteriota bacterium]
MFPDFDGPIGTDNATEYAAAETMRRAGRRLGAPDNDIDLVVDVLLTEVLS